MMKVLRRVARKLACLLMVSILVECIAPAGMENTHIAYAAEKVEYGKTSTVQGDGFTVKFGVDSAWDNHCVMNVIVTNTGTRTMTEWSFPIRTMERLLRYGMLK